MAQSNSGNVHLFGIRHHGPGSARSLREALEALEPDALLVEGPPDAADVLPLLTHAGMKPPVALLIYVADQPQRSVYYPFARFSPEWQALDYGLSRNIAVRFMDLPQTHQPAMLPEEPGPPAPDAEPDAAPAADPGPPAEQTAEPESEPEIIRRDPLRWLAEAAGYSDGERWWDHMVEHRRDSGDLFAAILEAMTALREAVPPPDDPDERRREDLREAYMRQSIRAAQKEGFQRIAVVCGAWHAPALVAPGPAKADAALLQGLPKVKVQTTWVPWTHGRLSYHSGYGAGIESPGWYEHLWSAGDQAAIRWMTRVARLLREEDLDASSAHVIESIRLAEALAALRDRPVPGLAELNEATQSILLFGDATPMALIHNKLIVGEVMGEVPDETPMVPLQKDLVREQRRLRMSPEALQKTLDLDLRNATDLERSYLLHRLNLLHLPWGQGARGSGKGTFHEIWTLQWQPEFAVALIEAAIWGHTVAEAATARTCDLADRAPDLPSVTTLLNQAMLANLPVAVEHLMACIQAKAAVAGDVTQLMAALPPLVNVARYGNVRRTDAEMVSGVIDGLVTRIAIGLPLACASLNDEAAAAMLGQMVAVDEAIRRSQNEGHLAQWQEALVRIADRAGVHGLVAGRSCRLLLDQNVFSVEETARRMGLALSAASDPAQAAAWVDGLLRGAGLVLLLNDALWEALDEWVSLLPAGVFPQLLPLLRRTFSTFAPAERRQMGERVRSGAARPKAISALASDFNPERADRVLPLAARLLGVALPGEASHA